MLTLVVVVALICGAIAAAIAQGKNNSVGGAFVLGCLLGVIGIIIAIAEKPSLPPAPPGLQVAKCPRCNAVQNIPAGASDYQCWQCHLIAGAQPVALSPAKPVRVSCPGCKTRLTVTDTTKAMFTCPRCGAVGAMPLRA